MTTYIIVVAFDRHLVAKKVTDGGGESSYTVIAECANITDANSIVAALS